MIDLQNPEFQALLSAYAMGTLTDDERTRLFSLALGNQEIFNAMMDEQATKDMLEHPLVRRALLRAIEKIREEQPMFAAAAPGGAMSSARTATPNQEKPTGFRPVWAALAASVVVGGLLWWNFFPGAKQVDEPAIVAEQKIQAVPTPRQAVPVVAAPPPNAGRPEEKLKKADATLNSLADSAIPAETKERKAESAEAPSTPPAATPPAPAVSAAKELAGNSFSAPAVAELSSRSSARQAAVQLPLSAQVSREAGRLLLRVSAPSAGFLYVFVEEGAGWRVLPVPSPIRLASGEQRSFALDAAPAGTELRLYYSASSDPVLEAALLTPQNLPQRPWLSLRVPR